MKKLILLCSAILVFNTFPGFALNVTIISSQAYNSGQTMDLQWQTICGLLGYTATIYPATELNLLSNLSTTDILIVSSAVDPALTTARTSVIQQYLQNGGKVYLQSEYMTSFPGNIAYQSLVDSLGGYFNWTGIVSGTLAPMDILGSIATDYAVTSPLTYFWYGQSIDPCSSVEMFLTYQANYFGCIFCVPSSSGRLITTSDQDWVFIGTGPQTDSLMKNIVSNLAKPVYNCANSGGYVKVNLGKDTTICSGNSLVLNAGAGYSNYLWQGGQTASSITVDSTGKYWVKVTTPCGAIASDTINIAVSPCNLPSVALLSSDSAFCANSCINFTDLSTNNPVSWLWTFQGAMPSTSNAQNPQNICYLNGGKFNVTLVATNSNGSDSVTYTNFIAVYDAPPTPTISQSRDTLYCSFDSSYTSYQWYADTALIPGATGAFLVISQEGNYNVQVTNAFGCSIAVGIELLGTKEFSINNSFALYPNPAGKELSIVNGKSGIENVIIYNVLGEIIKTIGGDSGKAVSVDISDILAGIYFVNIITKTGIRTRKFIKE